MEKCRGESRRSSREIQSYLGRIFGSLLDRIDLHVEVPQVKFRGIGSKRTGEDSAAICERAVAARQKQQARFAQRTTQPPASKQVPAESLGWRKLASIAPHTPSRRRTRAAGNPSDPNLAFRLRWWIGHRWRRPVGLHFWRRNRDADFVSDIEIIHLRREPRRVELGFLAAFQQRQRRVCGLP